MRTHRAEALGTEIGVGFSLCHALLEEILEKIQLQDSTNETHFEPDIDASL